MNARVFPSGIAFLEGLAAPERLGRKYQPTNTHV